MPQTINTFVKSKMNKDLDDRLLSNGEYRDAQNVNVSRSEGEDVGALENVLGNTLLSDFGLSSIPGLEIIGFLSDEVNNRAFFMATNYTDPSANQLDNSAPFGVNCYILMRDNKTNTSSILVQGRFLNFSKTHHIYGIDLIEDLLFWTDNRNQPRKINVNKAIANNSYYNSEDLISVAKYYPYNAIDLYTKVEVTTIGAVNDSEFRLNADDTAKLNPGMILLRTSTVSSEFLCFIERIDQPTGSTPGVVFLNKTTIPSLATTGGDVLTFISPGLQNASDIWLPPSSTAEYMGVISTTPCVIDIQHVSGEIPKVGMRLTNPKNKGVNSYTDNLLVNSVISSSNSLARIELNVNDINTDYTYSVGDIIEFSSTNGYAKSSWPGDSEFLKEKFVRFAYRFKFEDGEYSLISPFTQPAFVPKQGGYFIDKPSSSDVKSYLKQEEVVGSSTVVSFFENNINNVFLNINTPVQVLKMANAFNISEIEILYKESNELAIRVLDTISVTDSSITGNSTNIFNYNYQSRKPFRTLPSKEATRVFDKVPVRAMSQSVVGNRVVYGNFVDKHSPPVNLNYNVNIDDKYKSYYTSVTGPVRNYSRVSYPNHTVKQNRTYQVGIVLSDKYGRQSDVILSSLDALQFTQTGSNQVFDGSTVYYPYRTFLQNNNTLSEWPGDSLKVLFRDPIPNTQVGEHEEGYPGLYCNGLETAEVRTTATSNTLQVKWFSTNIVPGSILQIIGTTYTVLSVVRNGNTSTITISDSISVTNGDILSFKTPENKLGWYSYKIVVKQTEQDYYNVYLPNVCKTDPSSSLVISPSFPNEFLNNQSFFTSLLSDNINKISSDLQEVQPEQTQFRTSNDILYPRVGYNPEIGDSATVFTHFAANYYFGRDFATVDNIAKVTDMGIQLVNRNSIDLGRIKGTTFSIGSAQIYFNQGGTSPYSGQDVADFGTAAGNIVYNVDGAAVTMNSSGYFDPNQQAQPIKVKIKVNTINNNPSLNYLVVTEGGVEIDKSDFIFISAHDSSTPGYKEGDSEWDQFILPRKEIVGPNQTLPQLQAGEEIHIDSQTEGWTISTENGSNVLPLSAPGIYNASSNPSVANLSVDGKFIIGGDSDDNEVFSVFEIKPLDSKLELFWETSTCGLVSELNELIETGVNSQEIPNDFPIK